VGLAAELFYRPSADPQSLHSRITPTTEQREFLQENWNAFAEFLREDLSDRSGYPIATWIQGSYKFGTLIRPLSKGEEYDVDLGVYYEWPDTENATPEAKQLKDWTQAASMDYRFKCEDVKKVDNPARERCSRIQYGKQFHIDVPSYHLNSEQDLRRLATETKGWEESDPKAIYVWFKALVGNPERDQVRRLIRYMKAWAAVAFEEILPARPSSILLTVLVAQAFNASSDDTLDDEDAFVVVVRFIYDRLSVNRRVGNPVNEDEDLNRIDRDHWDAFMETLEKLRDAGDKAADAGDSNGAALAWSEVFSYVFPLPEAEGIEVENVAKAAVMVLPNIRIDVTDDGSGRHLGTYTNQVPSVPKKCSLRFTITNPEIIPAYATIEWTVRNEGREAEDIGDIGHRRITARKLTMDERTAYAGRQFMDCVVKSNGNVLAVRRVPVLILDVAYPPRNPPRPPYVRLRAKLRRR
jgi:hypothetical protein